MIIVVMIGEHAGRPLAAPDVEATTGHDPVHAAAGAQHWGCRGPGARLWVEDLMRGRHLGRQSMAETPANDMDAAIDRRARKVVALRGQVRQHLPGIGRRVVDGEVVSARRTSTGDVDFSVEHDGYPGAARRGHRRLRDPYTRGGIQLVDGVLVALIGDIRGLAAEQVDLSVDAGRHPVVVRLRERRSELPAIARDVVDLDRTGGLPTRRIAAEEVELAV